MGSSLLRPLSVGEILDGAFTVYRTKFATLLGAALVFALPGAALYFVNDALGMLVSFLVGPLATVSSVWIVSEFVLGKPVSVQEALGVALRKAIPFLAALVLYGVAMSIAIMLLLVPGVLAWFMWFAIAPVVVLEGKILFFDRSRQLAKKSWLKIFLVQLVTGIILALPTLFVYGAAIGMGDLDSTTLELPAIFQSMSMLISALTVPFSSATIVLLYYDQRVRKEGLDVELSTASLGVPSSA